MWAFKSWGIRESLSRTFEVGIVALFIGWLLDDFFGLGAWTILGALGASIVFVIGAIELTARFRKLFGRHREPA